MNIDALLDQMTLEEQVSLLAGADYWTTAAIERLGVPSVKVTDGPNGARGEGGLFNSTAAACFPCEVALGSTWDTALIRRIGEALAEEARSKGAQILLAPTVNLHRSGLSGRNFECFSEDPVLTAELAVSYIEGVQSRGIGATVKHFVANDSEYQRQTISSQVDERTLRELYLLPFEAAVKRAKVAAVMTGYNKLNGIYCSEQRDMIEDVLRGDWDFKGIVMSDWHGMADSLAPLQAGVDLEMPGPTDWRGSRIVDAVQDGRIAADMVRTSARRILQLIADLGAFAQTPDHSEQTIDRAQDRALIREAAAAGMVLLKNERAVLPLEAAALKSLAIIGPNAAMAQAMGGGSAQLNAHRLVSPLDGLTEALPGVAITDVIGATNHRLVKLVEQTFDIEYFAGQALEGELLFHNSETSGNVYWYDVPHPSIDARNYSARLRSSVLIEETGEYLFGLTSAGFAKLYINGCLLIDGDSTWVRGENFSGTGNSELRANIRLEAGSTCEIMVEFRNPDFIDGIYFRAVRVGMELPPGESMIEDAIRAAAAADAAILLVGRTSEWDTEGMDLRDMRLPGRQDELIARVARTNPRTIVVLQTGGPVEMPWIDEVPAVLQAWYPGQEVGHAIADVLLGHAEPGGRLPQSFPVTMADMPPLRKPGIAYPGENGQVRYEEGLFIGYRHFDRADAKPLFAFGHGLSYSQFRWSEPVLENFDAERGEARVAVRVENIGSRSGCEVVQLYVAPDELDAGTPIKTLRAFGKCSLAPGESTEIALQLRLRDFTRFDAKVGDFVAPPGCYMLIFARSATEEVARLTLELPALRSEPGLE